MIKPKIPENEKDRLREVYKYNLTEELSDDSLESIVEIASQICNMPISLISIVGDEKQFFQAKKGLEGKGSARDISFCSHAINKPDEMMIVPDTSKDERFKDNPFVIESPFIKFYAGIPILSPDDFPLGTLCVIDSKPNFLTEKQQNALRHLGKQVTLILELQKKNNLLKSAEQRLKVQANDMEDYTHIISHDLKEPVRMIDSFLDLFIKKYGNDLDKKARQYIDFARDGSTRINNLIEDLLEFSKSARISGSFKPVDLNLVVEDVLKSMTYQTEEKNAEIKISKPLPIVDGIESGLTQLFVNLISNSLKFIPKERQPLINISSEETETDFVVKIKDNGIGIPENQLKNIFTIFRRVKTEEKFSGSGIGLAIVKKIASIHNARITVNSEVGKGSEFAIYFPKKWV